VRVVVLRQPQQPGAQVRGLDQPRRCALLHQDRSLRGHAAWPVPARSPTAPTIRAAAPASKPGDWPSHVGACVSDEPGGFLLEQEGPATLAQAQS
jgi:hypothetical protein